MAEDRDDSQEKTEQATPKRQQDAKEKGQVGRSREFNTMCILMGSVLIMMIFGRSMMNNLLAVMHDGFVIERQALFSNEAMITAAYKGLKDMMQAMAPLLVGLAIIALCAPMAIGGWIFSAQSLQPKLEKMDPIAGFKRIFGPNGLMELFKAIAKFMIVTALIILVLWSESDVLLNLGNHDLKPSLSQASDEILWAFLILSSATFLVAIVDVPFQIWEHNRKLKMTKQEVKDEMKETEGRPEVKSQIRSMQHQLANQRMMEEVPKADVIITNPTHFAVALKYDQDNMGAPLLIAKGKDLLAQRIRQVANKHQVTVFSSPLLARALYHTTRINQQVPEGLYIAVAQVLAYVYQLKASQQDTSLQVPTPPDELPIPDEFQY